MSQPYDSLDSYRGHEEISKPTPKVPATPPCDQCVQRRIRCDKRLPKCRRCIDANLGCTREIIRRRPGRKRGSGLVISHLRSIGSADVNQSSTNDDVGVSDDSNIAARRPEINRRGTSERIQENVLDFSNGYDNRYGIVTTEESPTTQILRNASITSQQSAAECSSFYNTGIFESSNLVHLHTYVDQFFTELHPIWPLLHQTTFRHALNNLEQQDDHQRCLILSVCTLTLLHVPSSTAPDSEPRQRLAQRFIDECRRLRAKRDYVEKATLSTVQTSLFLSCAEIEFQRTRSSWFLLRESIMLAQELGYYEAKNTAHFDQTELLGLQRTLYLLSLTERGLTILRHKPVTALLFDSPPQERFEDEDPCILFGLQCLSKMFNLLDEEFLTSWLDDFQSVIPAQAKEKVLTAQHVLANMSFGEETLTDVQRADILLSHQWLRLVFWQSSMRQGLLSSAADESALTYAFPCQIAKSLCAVLQSLPISAIFVHGVAIFERIFEITYSFIDALKLSYSISSGLEELRIMFRVLRLSPNSHATYTEILEAKILEHAKEDKDGGEIIPLIYQ